MDTFLTHQTKICASCKEIKSVSDFSPKGNTFYSYCRPCVNKRSREKHAEQARREGRTLRIWPERPVGKKKCPKCQIWKDETEYTKTKNRFDNLSNYCKPCTKIRRDIAFHKPGAKEKRRSYSLKTAYGISIKEWNELYAFQSGRCALCGGEADGKHGVFHTDHNHETNEVRGLLCFDCNKLLGVYELLLREKRILSFDTYIKKTPMSALKEQIELEEVFN